MLDATIRGAADASIAAILVTIPCYCLGGISLLFAPTD
jgi:hypothetical protein